MKDKDLYAMAKQMRDVADSVLQQLGPNTSQDASYGPGMRSMAEVEDAGYQGNTSGAADGDAGKYGKMKAVSAMLKKKLGSHA
jgi:hypothetical protein